MQTDTSLVNAQSYKYTVRVEDAAGNRGTLSSEFTLNVDTAVPNKLAITEVLDDEQFVVGPITAGGYSNDRTPTVKGTGAEPNATIILKDAAGNVLGTTTADATGNWTVEPTTANALKDGAQTLNVSQVDKAGNESPAESFSFNVDGTAPTQSVVISNV